MMFVGFDEKKVWVKMQKLDKKKSLLASWEGPCIFVGYKDGKRQHEYDDGNKVSIFENKDG